MTPSGLAALAREIEERAKRIHSAYEYTAEASAVQVEQCTALRKALEGLEPVAWHYRPAGSDWSWKVRHAPVDPSDGYEVVPLYDLREQR